MIVQVLNPKTKRYTLIDTDLGEIIKTKTNPGPYRGVTIITPKKPEVREYADYDGVCRECQIASDQADAIEKARQWEGREGKTWGFKIKPEPKAARRIMMPKGINVECGV